MILHRAVYKGSRGSADVLEKLKSLIKHDKLFIRVSNEWFGDPCPGSVKSLIVSCEIDGKNIEQEVVEGDILCLPKTTNKIAGLFYTNNAVPKSLLKKVLGSLEKAKNVDIYTCSWNPIPDNPFPELSWYYHVGTHLTIALQILKLLYTIEAIRQYEYVCFLEHDVLYSPSYFEFDPFPTDVLSNKNYIGLCEKGFQPTHLDHEPLHQLIMRLPAAIQHFNSVLPKALTSGGILLEPNGRTWTKRESKDASVHVNHGNHFTSHFSIYDRNKIDLVHPYWGNCKDWWV